MELIKLAIVNFLYCKFPHVFDTTIDNAWDRAEFKASIVNLANQKGMLFIVAPKQTQLLCSRSRRTSISPEQHPELWISSLCCYALQQKEHIQPKLQAFPVFPLMEWHMLLVGDGFAPQGPHQVALSK